MIRLPSLVLLLHAGFFPFLLVAQQEAPPVTEGYLEAGPGVRLFYRLVGAGQDTLVVIHGGPGFSSDYFAHDLDPLTRRGHAILFYDQRGAGRSTLVTDSAALDGQRFAEDLEAVRRHFRLERMNMLGHSWGAGVVALYAIKYPDRVGRTLIVGGIPLRMSLLTRTFDDLKASRDSASRLRMEQWLAVRQANPEDPAPCRAYYAIWFHPFFVNSDADRRLDVCTGSAEARRNKIMSVDRYVVASLGDYDWRPALRTDSSPTLVMHGEKDVIPLAAAWEWVTTLPNSRLLVMRGVGHFLYMEAPEQFFRVVDEFLRGGWPAGGVN